MQHMSADLPTQRHQALDLAGVFATFIRTAVEDGTVTITHNLTQCDEDCTL